MSKAIVFMADGLEECEGLLVVDILRRAGTEVITASINGTAQVLSSHGIRFSADVTAEEPDYESADLLILPGGARGTENLAASEFVKAKCLAFAGSKKLAAICAAPSIFAQLGLLNGRKASVHPSFEAKMNGCEVTHQPVTVDGNITTGRALGAAIPFALELARQLEGEEAAARVAEAICWQ